ncbi:16S rRNA (guanine(527)-N(7))-methyltransferase (EC [Olavius algarvensis associated proteobacterium Delta 3]|nr:16S rRNA (guanine(527)-N(7))-methyltransferase (EC [Olavius algarvensis associated proteobacterium Delta 3]
MHIDSEQWRRYLIRGAETLGLALSDAEAASMALHARELLVWNRRTNLTRLIRPKPMAEKHYLDSILPMRWIPDTASILDVGSGGGFPGIPLKIVIPSSKVMLVDASRKKVTFMNHALRTLNLNQIRARHMRAESIDRKDADCPPGGFTVIISRALTSLERFVSMALPLLADDGMIIALKGTGQSVEAELSALNQQLPPDTLERLPSIQTARYRLPYSVQSGR